VLLGAIGIVFHRAIGILLTRSRPYVWRPWKGAARGNGAIVLALAAGLVASGLIEVFDLVGWLVAFTHR
jgi:hypothetical protein